MIKVYIDWNVMAQMKNGLHSELLSTLSNNKNLLKPYSTSHISDILSSYKENDEQKDLIEQDLKFISTLTDNAFLFNSSKEIVLEFSDPQEYYENRLAEKDLWNDLSLDGLLKNVADNELFADVRKHLDLLKQIPLDSTFKEGFDNPESAKKLETLFPGLKDNPTMEGFFKSFSEMNRNLNDSDGYKELRNIVQSGLGINRDKIFDNNNPYEFIQNRYKQLGSLSIPNHTNDKNAPLWFNEISNEYLMLDMHGYQEDKVNVNKGRKETFKNTTEDAFHAAFASTCNFYIINDKKSYKKTKQVYDKLHINTIVFKPQDFMEHYKNFLDFKDPNLNLIIPINLLKSGEYYEEQIEGAKLRTYYFPYFIFGFFTKLMFLLPENGDPHIMLLSRNKPTNGSTYTIEISKLVSDISALLGEDIHKLGEVKEDELKENNWIGRSWQNGDVTFNLKCINGHFQLYFDSEGNA